MVVHLSGTCVKNRTSLYIIFLIALLNLFRFGTVLGRRQSKPGTVTYITEDLIEEYRSADSQDPSQTYKTVDNRAIGGLYQRDVNTSKEI